MNALRDADKVLGHLQRHRSKDGTVLRFHDRRPRDVRVADELCPPPQQPESWVNFVVSFLTIGLIYIAFISWFALASASTVAP